MDKNHLKIVKKKTDTSETDKPRKKKLVEETLINTVVEDYKEKHEFKIEKFKASQYYAKIVLESIQNWSVTFEIEVGLDSLFIHFDGRKMEESQRLISSDFLWTIIEYSKFRHKDKTWILGDFCVDSEDNYHVRLNKELIYSHKEEWENIYDEVLDQVNDDRLDYYLEEQEIDEMHLYVTGDDGFILCELLEELDIITFGKVDVNLYEVEFLDKLDILDTYKLKIIFSNYLRMNGYNAIVEY